MTYPLTPIGKVIDKVISWDPSKAPSNHLFPYIDISSINRNTKRIEGVIQYWTHDAPSRARQIVKAGDILVSTVRPNLNAVAQVMPELDNATASTGFCVLRPDQKKLDGGYLYYWVRNPLFVSAMVKRATGANYPAISDTIVKESCLPLPPLPEQRRIATILDKAFTIQRKHQRVMERMEDFLRAVFLDMFGDPVTNSKGWNLKPLGDLVRFRTGKLDSNAAVEGGTYPFFTCSRENFWIDTYAFDCEALLLAGNNASADYSVKYYYGKFNAYQRTYIITLLNEINSYRYMKKSLEFKLNDLKRFSIGTNTKYLTLGILNAIKIQVPEKRLQDSFEKLCSETELLLDKNKKSARLTENLFNSLSCLALCHHLGRA